MNTDVIIAVRKLIDRVKEKFGEDAYLELFTDGSGFIRVSPFGELLEEFDGLGELTEVLGE